jgi:hypothetical protein
MIQGQVHWDTEWVNDTTLSICQGKLLLTVGIIYLDYRDEYQASVRINSDDLVRLLNEEERTTPEFLQESMIVY